MDTVVVDMVEATGVEMGMVSTFCWDAGLV